MDKTKSFVPSIIELANEKKLLPIEIARSFGLDEHGKPKVSRQRINQVIKKSCPLYSIEEIRKNRRKELGNKLAGMVANGVTTSQVASEFGLSVQSLYTVLRNIRMPVSKVKPHESIFKINDYVGLWEVRKGPYSIEKTNRRIPVVLCRCRGCGVVKEVRYRYLKEGKSSGCQNCRGKEAWKKVSHAS